MNFGVKPGEIGAGEGDSLQNSSVGPGLAQKSPFSPQRSPWKCPGHLWLLPQSQPFPPHIKSIFSKSIQSLFSIFFPPISFYFHFFPPVGEGSRTPFPPSFPPWVSLGKIPILVKAAAGGAGAASRGDFGNFALSLRSIPSRIREFLRIWDFPDFFIFYFFFIPGESSGNSREGKRGRGGAWNRLGSAGTDPKP